MTSVSTSVRQVASLAVDTLDFTLPPELAATAPPEARGAGRDDVRLLVSRRAKNRVTHHAFRDLQQVLVPGDLLVINTSATIPAALHAQTAAGVPLEIHLSTQLTDTCWTIEARRIGEHATAPFFPVRPDDVLCLPGGATARIEQPYDAATPTRLWRATLDLPESIFAYLARHGFPIRYSYTRKAWPLAAYQTVYASEPGSAEMPSAGRAFTPEIITRLVACGVQIAPLVLHTGVASAERHEPPYAEFFRVPAPTARAVNAARAAGSQVIAVGTTVVRALETVAHTDGSVQAGEGWTELVITPARGIRTVDGLLTGLHEPHASHLAMLETLVGREHLALAYAAALHAGYLWHEFGDMHLLLP